MDEQLGFDCAEKSCHSRRRQIRYRSILSMRSSGVPHNKVLRKRHACEERLLHWWIAVIDNNVEGKIKSRHCIAMFPEPTHQKEMVSSTLPTIRYESISSAFWLYISAMESLVRESLNSIVHRCLVPETEMVVWQRAQWELLSFFP